MYEPIDFVSIQHNRAHNSRLTIIRGNWDRDDLRYGKTQIIQKLMMKWQKI